jgi:hypothetical protein
MVKGKKALSITEVKTMKKVTVTITTDAPVNVKITPGKDIFEELLEVLGDNDGSERGEGDSDERQTAVTE